jgi:hypothetical protein
LAALRNSELQLLRYRVGPAAMQPLSYPARSHDTLFGVPYDCGEYKGSSVLFLWKQAKRILEAQGPPSSL